MSEPVAEEKYAAERNGSWADYLYLIANMTFVTAVLLVPFALYWYFSGRLAPTIEFVRASEKIIESSPVARELDAEPPQVDRRELLLRRLQATVDELGRVESIVEHSGDAIGSSISMKTESLAELYSALKRLESKGDNSALIERIDRVSSALAALQAAERPLRMESARLRSEIERAVRENVRLSAENERLSLACRASEPAVCDEVPPPLKERAIRSLGVIEGLSCLKDMNKSCEIYFSSNRNQLEPASRERVRLIARSVAENRILRVRLDGYGDRVGSNQKNKELSATRVEVVKAELLRSGVMIPVEGLAHGEMGAPVLTDDEVEEERNRVVLVTFER